MSSNTGMETMKIGLQTQLDNKATKEDLQEVKINPLENHDTYQLASLTISDKTRTYFRLLFSLQMDGSIRALKTELEVIENKCLNASNDVPTAEIQNQLSILKGRINSTNDDVEIQSHNLNQLRVRLFLYYYL